MRWSDETVRRMSWQERALCRDDNPEDFFPSGSADETKRRCKERCEVREQCLEYALEVGAVGVWGGTGTKERRKIKAERRRRAKAAVA